MLHPDAHSVLASLPDLDLVDLDPSDSFLLDDDDKEEEEAEQSTSSNSYGRLLAHRKERLAGVFCELFKIDCTHKIVRLVLFSVNLSRLLLAHQQKHQLI
jgi:hypothetical protein